MQDGPPLPRFWHVSSSAHFILQNNTNQKRPCKVTVLLQLPFSEGNKEQLLSGNGIQLLMALLYFKDIQHKLQANLDVSVSVTSEKSTPRTAEATTAEPGPRCSSSGPFRRVGNKRVRHLKDGARQLAHSSEGHSKEQRNSSMENQRDWQEQGQDLRL